MLNVGTPLLVKHTTKLVRATVEALHYKMDINGLRRDEAATELALNDIGRIRLHTTESLAIDDYQLNRATGSFILIDPHTNLTVGAGTVKFAAQHAPSPNVVRHTGKLTAEERYRHLGRARGHRALHRPLRLGQVDAGLRRGGALGEAGPAGLHGRRGQPSPQPL